MFNRFYEFSNLDLFSSPDLEAPGTLSPDFTKPAQRTALPQGDTDMDNEFFYQKSTQNLTNGYEISFEKNYIKQHQAAYEKELQNYMESFRIHQNKTGNSLNLDSLSQTHTEKCEQLLKEGQFSVLGEKTLTFLSQLFEYEKLSEFLDIVVSTTPKFIANELIGLASALVDKYQALKFQEPNDSELLKVAQEVSRSISFERLLAVKGISLTKAKDTSELQEKTRRFLNVFCATTILVIAQYFENPYADDECGGLKRPLSPWSMEPSEDQQSYEPSPSKKRKFSY